MRGERERGRVRVEKREKEEAYVLVSLGKSVS